MNIHVPKTTDLVLVEYTVNDIHHVMPLFTNEYRRAYERLLRKLLGYPNRPAVVLMHSFNWMAPPIGKFWSNLEREYIEFAWYYDLPSLSLKSSSFHQMITGVCACGGNKELEEQHPAQPVSYCAAKPICVLNGLPSTNQQLLSYQIKGVAWLS